MLRVYGYMRLGRERGDIVVLHVYDDYEHT